MNIKRLFILVLIFTTACATIKSEPTATPTLAPTFTSVPTDTPTPVPTNTPLPTNTPTPVPTNTPTPTATPNLAATQAFQATQTAEALSADFQKEMESYGITVDKGYLVLYDPQGDTIYMDSYGQKLYKYFSDDLVLSNFILKADINWESKTGLAGCGIYYRASDDIANGPSFLFATMRLSGAPAWDLEYYGDDGRFNYNVTGKVRYSERIKLEQGATNTYVLVAQGESFTVYANGGRIGIAESNKRAKGLFAYEGWQESGETTCSFTNIWIWALP